MAIPLLMLLRFSPCSRNSPLIFEVSTFAFRSPFASARPPFCSLRSITPTAITTRNTAISNKIPRNTRNPLPYHPSWLPANRLTITTRTKTAPSFHWTAMFPTASLIPLHSGPKIFSPAFPRIPAIQTRIRQIRLFLHQPPSLNLTAQLIEKRIHSRI